MSRLALALRPSDTGQRFAPMRRFSFAESQDCQMAENMELGYIYRLEATFRVDVRSTNIDLGNGLHEKRIEQAKRSVLREVFGEFVPWLREAEFAAMNYEGERAAKLIREVVAAFEGDYELKGQP